MAPGRKAKPTRPSVEEVEARLGHIFSDKSLLDRALTHPSAVSGTDKRDKSYQRLEFLGDRVLGLTVADLLYRTMPADDEGTLSRRLSDLVRAETCAEVAAELDLGQAIKVGPSESRTVVGARASVLADLCEAVIGAIYLDAGWGAAEAFVTRLWLSRLAAGPALQRDAKSALQEWAQGRGLPTPVYRVSERTGPDHQPIFTMAVVIPGIEDGFGQGAAKRQAEIAAATFVLKREGVWPDDTKGGTP
ncbi:ribonuclease III [Phreatobacter aquaticus]|uniref:Ribonuclease 3 n=1 Tax=Phreatobacter aquaticus TaxID=2570229 RepID=A0A4D7QNY3_9HYPH|nr:ribonuclease III [Phreatobacter aquaticus]